MNWTRENTLYFIHLIRERPAIWDATSLEFKNKYKRNDALVEVAKMMNVSLREVNTKWTSLRGQFNREKKKFSGQFTGPNNTPVESKWFAYSQLKEMMKYTQYNPYCNGADGEGFGDYSNNDYLEDEESETNKEWGPDTPFSQFASWQFKNNENSLKGDTNDSRDLTTPNIKEEPMRKRMRPNFNSIHSRRSHDQKLCIEYDTFGQYIAAQMKSLSEEDAVLAQTAINEIMCRYRLKRARRPDNIQSYQTNGEMDRPNSPSPCSLQPVDEDLCIVKCETESDH